MPAPEGFALASAMPAPERFALWNEELKRKEAGRDTVFLDLDAVDHNADVVRSTLGSSFALRLVTKSLPNLDLLEYLMRRLSTRRLMAFSEGVLCALLDRFGAPPNPADHVDILLGRPMPVEAARRVLEAFPVAARDVRWLVDTVPRAVEYQALARAARICLDIALEIDVGLRRGGARTTTELDQMLGVLEGHPSVLRFAGLMGYEGHVPYAPEGLSADDEFAAVLERYADFVRAVHAHPGRFGRHRLVFNSGGSLTFARYGQTLATPINDIAVGSALVFPADFEPLAPLGLEPATFCASPILKRIDPAEVPFAPGYMPMLAQSDPNLQIAFIQMAGGFPGDMVYPAGLIPNPLISPGGIGKGITGLLPNQILWNGPAALPLDVGDFVFFHPWQGDCLIWADSVGILRNDHLTAWWTTLREGRLLDTRAR